MDLPSPTAATIELKLSSAKTMSEASFATCREGQEQVINKRSDNFFLEHEAQHFNRKRKELDWISKTK